ncbi:MAG: hypothetical protein WD906_01570 [Anaerolineales bacterium]
MSTRGTEGFSPPYPPSWFDRFTDWVDRLPGPAWAFYLVLGLGAGGAGIAIQWVEGGSVPGSLYLQQVWILGNFVYLLGLTHYLDKSAASAIASFRPLLHSAVGGPRGSAHDSSFASLSYQLTTLPSAGTLLATLVGVAFAIALSTMPYAAETILIYFPGIADAPTAMLFVKSQFILQIALLGPLAYHTIHQLALISRIYTQHARINIYQLQPLYALSLPGAFTGIGFILGIYVWFVIRASTSQVAGPLEIGLSVVFAAIAGATFALPLLGAHRRLVDEKNRRLAEAASRFEAAAQDLHRQLDGGRLRQMDPLNKALASLEIEQNALRRIATWPWQPGAVRGLLAALLLPVVVWVIQFLLGRILGT